jgi:hypothetical protein
VDKKDEKNSKDKITSKNAPGKVSSRYLCVHI